MSNIIQLRSTIQDVQELPNGDSVNLALASEWEELSDDQKVFISNYFELFPQKTKARLLTGVSESQYTKWIRADKSFQIIYKLVEDLHNESLANIEYKKSYSDDTVRGRFLKSKNGKAESSKTTNVLNIGQNIPIDDFLKTLN